MPESSTAVDQLKQRLKVYLVELLHQHSGRNSQSALSREAATEQLLQAAHSVRAGAFQQSFSAAEQQQIVHDVIDEVMGYGPLDIYFADPTISEIMVNGPDEIFIEREGRLIREAATFQSYEHLMAVIERMLDAMHLSVNEANPICDATLPDGSRINVIISPLVLKGPVVTIRRKLRAWTMENFLERHSLTPQVAEFLRACVGAKINMVISGGTSTGKTTLVAILSHYIPPDDRIITIENVPELDLLNRKHWIQLIGKQANMEGRGEVPLRALVKNALRMRPDRIILGEARGGEALDVVQAMHSGHDGFMTVLHANSPKAALERLETLMLMSGLELPTQACRTQIASAVDIVVHLARFIDGSRGISSIVQVSSASKDGFEMEELFALEVQGFSEDERLKSTLRYTGIRPDPEIMQKFQLNRVVLPSWMQ